VTLDTEVIIVISGQGARPSARFYKSLGQGDTGRDRMTTHLTSGLGFVSADIIHEGGLAQHLRRGTHHTK